MLQCFTVGWDSFAAPLPSSSVVRIGIALVPMRESARKRIDGQPRDDSRFDKELSRFGALGCAGQGAYGSNGAVVRCEIQTVTISRRRLEMILREVIERFVARVTGKLRSSRHGEVAVVL